jgi:hypothetical protein
VTPRVLPAVFAVGLCAGCGESTTTPSAPANLTGSWTGQIGVPGTGTAVRVEWTAMQPASTASGPAKLTKPALGVQVLGVMVGLVDGQQVSLSFVGPLAPIPSLPSCSVLGSGSGTAASSTITGTLNLIANNCGDAIESVTNMRLTLSR